MKPYIKFNTRLETCYKNEFEKDFFKLMKNSVFGKPKKNIRNYIDINLVTCREKYVKYVMKPTFKDGYPFPKELCCRDGKNQHQDELTSALWTGNIGFQQVFNV